MDSDFSHHPTYSPKLSFLDVDHSFLNDFAYGVVSGSVKALFYPFENLQTILAERKDYKAFKRRDAYFSGVPKIFREGGLFRGFIPTVKNYSIWLGLDLAFFFQIKYAMYPKDTITKKDIAMKANLICGLMASLASYAILTPLFEVTGLNKNTFTKGTMDKVKKLNTLNVYKWWRYDIPHALFSKGLLIGMYETKFKRQYHMMKGKVPYFMRFLDAYALAIFSEFCAYPFEQAKKRMMEAQKINPEHPEEMFRKLAQEKGAMPFLQGISKIFLTQASTALALTIFYSLLEHRKDEAL